MIEKDSVAGEQTVSFTIIYRHPVRVDLGRRIGAAWLERRMLALRTWRVAVHFAARRLVEPRLNSGFANGFEQPYCSQPGDFGRILRHVETDANVALSAKVVDFVRFHGPDDLVQRACIVQVAIDQPHPGARIMRVLINVVDPSRIEGARTAYDSVHDVALREQKLRQIRTILSSDAGNQCFLHLGQPGNSEAQRTWACRLEVIYSAASPKTPICSRARTLRGVRAGFLRRLPSDETLDTC